MTADDHAAEVDALGRRFPGWTFWFGPFTRRWWALPPRELDVGDFLEADTPQALIAQIEAIRRTPPSGARGHRPPLPDDTRRDARRPSNLLRLEGVTPSPFRRAPAIAWPGGSAG
ncbi:hypothetical protein [Actinomadura sp. WAC 06369]|uniref:hypothetical protein n=1 Tax=Actinomadura sp. WAC 06369 TaxID=2203193 RepID=UPI000F783D79|nr:hypothetical protein [Actinomadura sp. WAC 06369]RSN58256.1 hypothetical protein DMH08_22890 [Actinomadura sp. WAC 06369]